VVTVASSVLDSKGKEVSDGHEDATLATYQLARHAVGGFDAILVTLLTQGNTFIVAILSVPLVATLDGFSTAWLMGFALLMSLFLLLANYLYWNLLTRAVQVAEQLEAKHLQHLPKNHHLTRELDRIPLSAGRGSMLLYLCLPPVWSLAAIALGWRAMGGLSDHRGSIFLLVAALLIAFALLVFGFLIRRGPAPEA
jgi:hypothetical protein